MIVLALALAVATAPSAQVKLNQRQLDEISAGCRTPKAWLSTVDGEIRMKPPSTARYEQVDCVVVQLQRRHASKSAMVGNEAYAPAEPN